MTTTQHAPFTEVEARLSPGTKITSAKVQRTSVPGVVRRSAHSANMNDIKRCIKDGTAHRVDERFRPDLCPDRRAGRGCAACDAGLEAIRMGLPCPRIVTVSW